MNTATAGKVQLRIPARPEFLKAARLAVGAIASDLLDVEAVEDIKLAVGEACTNAIEHGGAGRPNREIEIVCSLHPDQLAIEVRDAGVEFDLARCVEVDLGSLEPTESDEEHFGLFLIRSVMDELCLLNQAGVGTLVRMVKRCSRPA